MSSLDILGYVKQGRAFWASNQVAKATTALSTTNTGLILYNPWGSGKRLVIYNSSWVFTTLPTGIGGVWVTLGNAVSAGATPAGTADVIWNADGSGIAVNSAARVFTIATTLVVNVYAYPLSMCLTGTTVAGQQPAFPEGGIGVAPGNYASINHFTTVATGVGSFNWIEIDI